jgi:hypothetical protein
MEYPFFHRNPGCILAAGVVYFIVGLILLVRAILGKATFLFAILISMLIPEAGTLGCAFQTGAIALVVAAPWRRSPRNKSSNSASDEGSPCIAAVKWKSGDIDCTFFVLKQHRSGIVSTRIELLRGDP